MTLSLRLLASICLLVQAIIATDTIGEVPDFAKDLELPDEVPCSLVTQLQVGQPWMYWETPNYRTGGYQNNTKCFWQVSAPEGYEVQLTIIQGSSESCCDYVEIFSAPGSLRGKVGGSVESDMSRVFDSAGDGLLTVYFHTDDTVTAQGFSGLFQLIPDKNATDVEEGSTFGVEETTGSGVEELDFADTTEPAPELFTFTGELHGSSSCNITFSVQGDEEEAYFYSPGYPYPGYDSNVECTYRFNAPVGKRIKIDFIDGETEECCDLLEFSSGLQVITGLSGVLTNKSVTSLNDQLSFVFRSDSSYNKRGFYGTYSLLEGNGTTQVDVEQPITNSSQAQLLTEIEKLPCGYKATADGEYRNLRTPGFPYVEYQNSENCTWTVEAPEGHKLEITLEAGQTEACCDFLTVTEYNSSFSQDLAKFSGKVPATNKIITSLNRVTITFISDSSSTDDGYRVSYKAVDASVESTHDEFGIVMENYDEAATTEGDEFIFDETTIIQTTTPTTISTDVSCGFEADLTNEWQNISTPNYPENYPNSVKCEWKFTVSEVTYIEVHVATGETEACCDFVEVVQYNQDMQEREYIGSKAGRVDQPKSVYFIAKPGFIVVSFTSDKSVSYQGLFASIRTIQENEADTDSLWQTSEAFQSVSKDSEADNSDLHVDGSQLTFLPGCTAEQFLNDLISCSSLFWNDFPYAESYQCSINSKLFMKCIQRRTDYCIEGTNPSLFTFLFQNSDKFEVGRFEEAFLGYLTKENHLGQLCDQTQTKQMITSLMSEPSSMDVLNLRQYLFGTDLFNTVRIFLLDLLQVKTPQEFCRVYDIALELIPQLNWNIVSNAVPWIIRNQISSNVAESAFSKLVQLTQNLNLPKCLAFKEVEDSSSGCLQKELDITFIVQGSGYTNDHEFEITRSFISNLVSRYESSQLRMSVILYSKYVKNKSLKNQPFVNTEVEPTYFNSPEDFESSLEQIQRHKFDGSAAFAGRAIKKAFAIAEPLRAGENCTRKVIILIMKNKPSDFIVLRNALPKVEKDNYHLFVIGVENADVTSIKKLVPNKVGSVFYADKITDHYGSTTYAVHSQMDSMLE